MNQLVVYCHPNPNSFNHAIKEALVAALKDKGHDVRVRDLYAVDFHPVLSARDFQYYMDSRVPAEIQVEQDHIKWSDVITFVYPIWWTGMPAMVKGYIDRVFTEGFAYDFDADGIAGLLKEKKAFIFNTTGAAKADAEKMGMAELIKHTSDDAIFKSCGMEVIGHKFFFGVPMAAEADLKAMLEDVKKTAEKLA